MKVLLLLKNREKEGHVRCGGRDMVRGLGQSSHWLKRQTQAVNKINSISCPAGGRNYGQSGGRNF